MAENSETPPVSFSSYRAHVQFFVGIALISVIPLLALCYLAGLGQTDNLLITSPWQFLIYVAVVAALAAGYALLRKYPVTLFRLTAQFHREAASRTARTAPDRTARDAAVEEYMQAVVDALREEMTRAQKEAERLQRKLAETQKIESLTTMAAGVAHDFNNFLASVLGNITIVLRHLPSDSTAHKNAREVESSALRALDLTNQILLFSGRDRPVSASVDLTAVVSELAPAFRDLTSRGVQARYQLAPNLPAFQGDGVQIRQAVLNLFTNAAEATEDRSGTITVSTGVEMCDRTSFKNAYPDEILPAGEYVYVDVTDEGRGITPEVQARMFDPFFTTKLRGEGMGLAVVLGVVRVHRGTIRVQGTPGKGASFRILFPTTGLTAAAL
jgi:signal transduction histidine kinase